MRKYHTILILLTLLSAIAQAQNGSIEVTGNVIETKSKQPIPYATVAIVGNKSHNIITGATTAEDGSFKFQTDSSDFYIEISFIGFVKKTIKNLTLGKNKVELGTVELVADSKNLDEVVIEAERSTTEFRLDKRVFNVGKDLSSTGASALEVLNNVPSVNVNIEG